MFMLVNCETARRQFIHQCNINRTTTETRQLTHVTLPVASVVQRAERQENAPVETASDLAYCAKVGPKWFQILFVNLASKVCVCVRYDLGGIDFLPFGFGAGPKDLNYRPE